MQRKLIMTHLSSLYSRPLALLTDLYQLTMACGYWKGQMAGKEAAFHLTFRQNPFGSGYSVACGLHTIMEVLNSFRFTDQDLGYLKSLAGNEYYIGVFYYKSKHYKAALHRFMAVLSSYPDVGYHQKALQYIAKCEASLSEEVK